MGKKVRCKACSLTFVAEVKKNPNAKNSSTDDDESDGKAYGLTEESLVPRCPNCANELLSEKAIICHHCGYNNRTRMAGITRKTYDITGGDVFLWLLPGILAAIFAITILVFDILFYLKIDAWVQPGEGTDSKEGPWYEFMAHGSVKLWTGIFSLFFLFFLSKFAINRLILNNKPPEVERN